MTWARNVNKWHDEIGPYHLRNPDNSPACGARYFSCNGAADHKPSDHEKCGLCRRVERKRARESEKRA